ncbi:(Fe-S)-binding protein [Paenibacillus sp. N1-5-1-14]|uniref:(Fe-S)-binding protein n=1 Tax=Paenibacillus radicibacter TaxID=2972488 RepID=UPI002158B2B7|nr:(Fe-S)-binding protein [Paenibacillus radicibacter]MCR8643453.1 (Fe-S)-binding protein [Paenibacillus radicibacter]
MNVSLFITCISDAMYPNVGKAVVNMLRHVGCTVDFPINQACCGQPAFNSGYVEDTKKAARQMIDAFEQSEWVVTPSGSCAAMVRHYYPTLFADDDKWREKAQQLADKTYEFSEFIVQKTDISKIYAEFEGIATYHCSCHMTRGLRIIDEPLQLIQSIQSLQLVDLPYKGDCCGFGGTFAVKMHDISGEMVDEKARHIIGTGANVLLGSDMACLMNIEGRLRRLGQDIKAYHVAELLDEGVRRYERKHATIAK